MQKEHQPYNIQPANRLANVSEYYFSRKLKEVLYSEARNLLALSEFSIQQIATELHFSDQASFSKFFKRWAGISPLEFRNVMVKSKK